MAMVIVFALSLVLMIVSSYLLAQSKKLLDDAKVRQYACERLLASCRQTMQDFISVPGPRTQQ